LKLSKRSGLGDNDHQINTAALDVSADVPAVKEIAVIVSYGRRPSQKTYFLPLYAKKRNSSNILDKLTFCYVT